MRKTQLRWFGVKTLYRNETVGKPRARDPYFDPSLTMVEERVVIFQARSSEEAMRKAEREARKYGSAPQARNPYGQRRTQRYLEAVNCFELFEDPASGEEVYSDTFLVKKSTSDQRLIDSHLIRPESERLFRKRRNFLNEAFNKLAGA